jgi:outer membrane receptor protein involved in Fe transport
VGNDTLGTLRLLHATFENIGEQTANGVDLGGYYSFDLDGRALTFGLSYSRLLEFSRVERNADSTGFVRRDLTGEYEFPVDRATLSADWGNAKWGLYANVAYIGTFEDAPDVDFNSVLDFDTQSTRKVGPSTTVNLQARYTGFKNLKLLLGLDNVFDEMPPFAIGDGDADIYGYVQNLHSPRGRFWSAKAVFNF